jgi:hypothetical protein
MFSYAFSLFNIKPIPLEETCAMSWNYRVILIPADADALFSEDAFVIREVFYNEDDEIEFWSEEDATSMGTTFEELCDDYDNMTAAFEKPILLLTEDENGEPCLIELDDEEDEE